MSQRTGDRQRILVSKEGEGMSSGSWILPHAVTDSHDGGVTFFLDDDQFTMSSDGSACPVTLRSTCSDLGEATDILLSYLVATSRAWHGKSWTYFSGRDALTVSAMVSAIRDSFSLNISQTAKVLRVERPTIYSWIREESAPRRSNRTRIEELYDLARWWQSQSEMPIGDLLLSRSSRGDSLFGLLCARHIDRDAVEKFMWKALDAIHSRESQRPSVRDRATAAGIDLSKVADQGDEIDTMTGRPMSSE